MSPRQSVNASREIVVTVLGRGKEASLKHPLNVLFGMVSKVSSGSVMDWSL